MLYYEKKDLYIHLLLIVISFPCLSQNCYNSDFETGDVSGYTAFTGSIDSDGNISIENSGVVTEQHHVFSVFDGYDEIAMEFCDLNKLLTKVPPIGGAYALRLGNSDTGGQAEKIQLRFTVTGETSFFLLRYAVLLNDPGHNPEEQPRFKLSIQDANGVEYPCGKYEVFAAPQIENFESCREGWRVRPWTNVGIELLSYLGQEVFIELSTNDCSRKGHAGYAYVDATCQPLEIELLNNCSDTSFATMQVTPGFDKYQWSTGDNTSNIQIDGPTVGDIYYVTVTSATGCELVLSDTIPAYETFLPPIFDEGIEQDFCIDTSFWLTPTGTNLDNIYSVEYGTFVDSVVVNTLSSQGYTFIAFSDSGCPQDTVTYKYNGAIRVQDSIGLISCHNESNGAIYLEPSDGIRKLNYSWETGDSLNVIDSLSAGSYQVTITDEGPCELITSFTLDEPSILSSSLLSNPIICQDSFNSSSIFSTGGTSPYQYSYNGGMFTSSEIYNYTVGDHEIVTRDDNGCLDTIYATFDLVPFVQIAGIDIANTSCNENNGSIQIQTSTSNENSYQINGEDWQFEPAFLNLSPGTYVVYATNKYGCIDSSIVEILESDSPQIESINVEYLTCENFNNEVNISAIGGLMPYTYNLDTASVFDSSTFIDLAPGFYSLVVTDGNGCTDEDSITIITIDKLTYEVFDQIPTDCGVATGEISFQINGGVGESFIIFEEEEYLPDHIFTDLAFGSYDFYIADESDCFEEVSLDILADCDVYIPNVFSPNGDDNNDVFKAFTSPNVIRHIYQFNIFDKWGELVYSVQNINTSNESYGWDGTFKNKLAPQGVYTYVIDIEFYEETRIKKSGNISLIR